MTLLSEKNECKRQSLKIWEVKCDHNRIWNLNHIMKELAWSLTDTSELLMLRDFMTRHSWLNCFRDCFPVQLKGQVSCKICAAPNDSGESAFLYDEQIGIGLSRVWQVIKIHVQGFFMILPCFTFCRISIEIPKGFSTNWGKGNTFRKMWTDERPDGVDLTKIWIHTSCYYFKSHLQLLIRFYNPWFILLPGCDLSVHKRCNHN